MEVVAAVVTFGTVAAQLAVVSVKLRRLWDEVTDVPDRIRELLADIEHVQLLFAEMEASMQDPAYPNLPLSFWTGPLMQHSLYRARRALADLQSVTEELSKQLKTKRNVLKQKLVAIRGFVDKDKIQALESRLARCLDLLWKSYDLASRRLLVATLHRQMTHPVKHNSAYPVPARVSALTGDSAADLGQVTERRVSLLHHTDGSERSPPGTSCESKQKKAEPFTRRTPQRRALLSWRLWWSTTVWELCSAPQPGWDYGLRVYNIVPEDSQVIRYVQMNDATAVAELFRERKASPFDRDPENRTLLWHAARNPDPSLDLFRLLLQCGLSDAMHDPDAYAKTSSPFRLVTKTALGCPNPEPESRQVFELLWSYNSDDTYFLEEFDSTIPFDDGRLPDFYDYGLWHRFSRVRHDSLASLPRFPVDLSWVAKDRTVLPDYISLSEGYEFSLLHSAALQVGAAVTLYLKDYGQQSQHTMLNLFISYSTQQFVQGVAAASTLEQLRCLERICWPWRIGPLKVLWVGTPLLSVIGSAVYGFLFRVCYWAAYFDVEDVYPTLREQQRAYQWALRIWVSNLQRAGVDILAYGREENAELQDDDCYRSCFDAESEMLTNETSNLWYNYAVRKRTQSNPLIPFQLASLKFDAEPGEWEIGLVFEFEAVAREFWDLIEHPPKPMPGSWVE